MTEQQKKFIEDNIDLIRHNKWAEFFDKCFRVLLSHSVGGLLYEAGFDFMTKLNYVPDRAFQESNIQTIVIPNNITSIGLYAFSNCRNLTSVTIPSSVESIEYGAFLDCSNLTSISIPDRVKNIDEYTFYGCRSLTIVKIGEGVKSIGKKAFLGCSRLTSIVLPHSVTSIRKQAFCVCKGLTSIEIPESVKRIEDDAFYDCNKITINYDGTKADWKNLIGSNSRVFKYTTYTCTCSDGIVKKTK